MPEYGAPLYIRSDNGPELISRAILAWIVDGSVRNNHYQRTMMCCSKRLKH